MPSSPTTASANIPKEVSSFSSFHSTFEITETKYSVRILKMHKSTFIYIGINGREFLDEIGIAMPMADSPGSVVNTVALGPQLGCDSQQLAQKLAKRLNKQIYVSCNIPFDRMVMPLLEKNLVKIIQENPEVV
ncbi:uncharacterized protein LOC129952393 [Eupeodes corollae]|uniref:uncharacterized protein LOC129952393 n=1 Tax=Eupeodes corollae TaxID=290404 RepID=UPI00248FAA0D|nr:uncharacterized protein LOC129952393 [Eupeodes corollae]XP_055920922.1 uncharacterized protein LOC129952393 [Eupeodes corollae]